MDTDVERLQVEFHNMATPVFFLVCKDFEGISRPVNRRTQEHHFQELKKTYVNELHTQLQTIAEEILHKYQGGKTLREIDPMIHRIINYYLHRFVQKIEEV